MKLRRIPGPTTLLIACFMLATLSAHGYPISPVPLWELTERAQLIVLAEVRSVRPLDTASSDLHGAPSGVWRSGTDAMAHLRILEVWKGSALKEVEVAFNPNLICPAPPKYVEGKTVAAFLSLEEGEWSTVGLSYGTLYPRASDMADLRNAVREAVGLQRNPRLSEPRRLDWLVKAASKPATRWHGLYELMPQSDSLHFSYDEEGSDRPAFLTAAQKEAIAAGLVAHPAVDRTLPMLLKLLEDFPSAEVDRAAASAVEALLLRERPPWWIGEALQPLFARFGDLHPEVRVAPLGEKYSEVEAAAVRAIWSQAKTELRIPSVEPAEDPEVEVWGVGSNTPS